MGDVTPRRSQKFKPNPCDKIIWTNSGGNSGAVIADRHVPVTVEAVAIKPGTETTITIGR